MSEKDTDIWNECVAELSPEGQQEADMVLRSATKKVKAHTDAYNERRIAKKGVSGFGNAGVKELLIALIKGGHL